MNVYVHSKQFTLICFSKERPVLWGALIISVLFLRASVAFGGDRVPVVSLKELREQGVVMQKWETSCAAASVATVLTYGFRDAVSEGYVASQMLEHTDPALVRNRGGFSLLDMKRFVENRGYTGKAYKNLKLQDLRLFHTPIVPITPHGYNHYVVFIGTEGDQVLLADSAFGNRKMRISRFLEIWLDGLAFIIARPTKEAPAPHLSEPSDSPPSSDTTSQCSAEGRASTLSRSNASRTSRS